MFTNFQVLLTMIHLLPNWKRSFVIQWSIQCNFLSLFSDSEYFCIFGVICSVSQFIDCRQSLVVALPVFVVVFKTLSRVLIQRSNIFLQKAVRNFLNVLGISLRDFSLIRYPVSDIPSIPPNIFGSTHPTGIPCSWLSHWWLTHNSVLHSTMTSPPPPRTEILSYGIIQ